MSRQEWVLQCKTSDRYAWECTGEPLSALEDVHQNVCNITSVLKARTSTFPLSLLDFLHGSPSRLGRAERQFQTRLEHSVH